MNSNYFIIHGSYGNPYKNWIPWLRGELAKRKLEVIVPNFPNLKYQNYTNWSKILDSYLDIGCINENTIFITHSLGSIFIMKYIIENKIKVRRIISVSGFNNIYFNDDEELYRSFYLEVEKLKDINKYCNDIICLYSLNDPFVPVKEAHLFIDNCNAKKVLIEEGGHFNLESGYKEFKELLNYIK